MSNKKVKENSRWVGGVSDFLKEIEKDSYYLGRSIDHRSDPRSISLLPRTIKESGSVVTDLPMWAEIVGTDMYIYGNTGNFYKRSSAGIYTLLRTIPASHGNGTCYFGEDDFIYYSTDKVIGRYGPVSNNPTFVDDYFGSQGGIPLNTNSLYLVSASSQYASRADTATLSIISDLSLEAQIRPTILPSSNGEKTIISKWNENGNLRSYKLDITTETNIFGDGSDGALVVSSNTTESPIDSACTGTTATTTLTATNASFVSGQRILIHQSRGNGAGTYQLNKIVSYTAGTITLYTSLNATYTTGAQVRVLKQHTNVTVNTGVTYKPKAWDGTVGGILAFLANGSVTITGTVSTGGPGRGGGYSALATGFRGGTPSTSSNGKQGEGTGGDRNTVSTYANGSGGGGGTNSASPFPPQQNGGGGGNGTEGITKIGEGGSVSGSADLTSITFGGGGGSGGGTSTFDIVVPTHGGEGGYGGGIVFFAGVSITVTGGIMADGTDGQVPGDNNSAGGGGAGGSVLIKCQTATLGTGLITARGGVGGPGVGFSGGDGGDGRIHIDYLTSYTGTSTPTINATLDSTLGSSDGYILRLKTSSNGTNTDTYSRSFSPVLDIWQHVSVSLDVSTSTATFFYNGVSLGTSTGSLTSISDNTSEFFVGAYKNGSGTVTGFYDGYIDEARVWNREMSADDFLRGISQQIATTTPYLNSYYKFNGDLVDSTANSNNLTGSGSPTYPTVVPFPSPTTRLDIDQSSTTTGNTYTTPIAISESTTNRKTFVPAKDPQKSIAVLVAAKGTGNWTLTIHDAFNNTITSATILNASITVGYTEFTFASNWRPLLNANYHFHLTSTVADGTVTTTTASDLETVSYRTYFQFLVTDTEWHPVSKMLQFLVVGNERYVSKYEAGLFYPNHITLPSGYRVRCFGYWREYLAIGTMRGSDITQQDAGRVYFWDGIATTYNFYIDVPEGGINALQGAKGKLYIWAGYQGDLLLYMGGDSADQIKRANELGDGTTETYPGAVTMWKMLIRYGTGNTTSTDLQTGVYTWGSPNSRYPDSLSFDYVTSTGSYSNTVKIGMLRVMNKKLFIGYQDNVSYGVDYVDADNLPYPTGEIQEILDDDGAVWKEKQVLVILADFLPLASGESVDVKYKLDRAGSWKKLGAVTAVGSTQARFVISEGGSRYREIQYGVDLATTTTTSPTLIGLSIERDFLESEGRV